tara:strand:+ start:1916 stop:3298 length:1383 start_codon:yes stop_codon:yes gene_type:complete
MFDVLSDRLGAVLGTLKGHALLSEGDIVKALREVRIALLEADVALPVVKEFVDNVHHKASGSDVLKNVSPSQMVIKIVHDELVTILGEESESLDIATVPPACILMVGLQGSGKTTTAAKIAYRLKNRDKKKVLLASLDTQRPAAQEQLAILGKQADVPTLPIVANQIPIDIARRAINAGKLQGFDVVILDTAGRIHADAGLMADAAALREAVKPVEVLLVADALTGQDAVNLASQFKEKLDITGVVLTRIDGDARGGAALSIRAAAGCPIKLLGNGEKLDDLDGFYPDRIASRILGMGDVVSLVEKAQETIEEQDAAVLEKRLMEGRFDLSDLASQLQQVRKMGGMSGILGLLPGVGKVKTQMTNAGLDERALVRQEAIIGSMTNAERQNARLINGARKRRIASGSGTSVQEVNRLLKQYKQMSTMVKKVGRMGKKGILRQGMPNFSGIPGLQGNRHQIR